MEKKPISIYLPQFDRTEKLDYDTPKTIEEFTSIVSSAPTEILFGFGFRKWSSMNDCIKENIERVGQPESITVPAYSLDQAVDAITAAIEDKELPEPEGGTITLGGHRNDRETPKNLLEQDEDIWLFPKEWYDLIPNGFIVTGLNGESYPFESGKSDDDTRFGCLAYGIRKPI